MLIVAIPSLSQDKFFSILNESSAADVGVAFVPSTHLPSEFWIEHADIDGLLLASIGAPSERRFYAMSKRVLDIVGSLAIAVVTLPLWAATAVLIRIDSPGKAVFVQDRVG